MFIAFVTTYIIFKDMLTKTIILILVVLQVSNSLKLHSLQVHQGLDLNSLRNAELDRHNFLRAKHGSPPLTFNASLNTIAQDYSATLLSRLVLQHSSPASNGQYGENLYYAWGYPAYSYPNNAASNSWYAQNANYDYSTGKSSNGKVTGHFTAMIWKDVKTVGFGYSLGPAKGGSAIYVVANYYPPPNYIGQQTKNIGRPL